MKKLISILACGALMLGSLPVGAFADEKSAKDKISLLHNQYLLQIKSTFPFVDGRYPNTALCVKCDPGIS